MKLISCRKLFVRISFICVALATALLLAISFINWKGQRAWERYRADAEKRGVKFDISEFTTPRVPDDENFAAIPLIHACFPEDRHPVAKPDPLALPHVAEKRPEFSRSLVGGSIDLTAWRDWLLKTNLLESPGENAASDVLRALEKYEPELRQIRDAAPRPRASFPVQWRDGFATVLPHLQVLRSATVLFALRAEALLALDRIADAVSELRHGFRIAHALDGEPSLTCGLVRIAIIGICEDVIWNGLRLDRWSEADLHALADDLGKFNLLESLRFAIDSQRVLSNVGFDEIAGLSGARRKRLLDDVGASVDSGSILKGWLRQSQVTVNRILERHVAKIDVSAGVLTPDPDLRKDLDRLIQRPGWRQPSQLFARLVLPSVLSLERYYLRADAQVKCAHLACLLALHRKAHGEYPARLAALVPAYLEMLPIDACAGDPLHYERTGDGYKIWSVGMDRKDDGGSRTLEKDASEPLDWVWEIRR